MALKRAGCWWCVAANDIVETTQDEYRAKHTNSSTTLCGRNEFPAGMNQQAHMAL